MSTKSRLVPCALLLLAAPAAASTWIVDDNGGAGVDFTDIPPALAGAQPGDVVVVRPGTYSPFTLTAGVSILGDAGAIVNGTANVTGVPGGPRAALVRLQMRALVVTGCAGPVIGDDLDVLPPSGTGVSVTGSADVRLRRLDARFSSFNPSGTAVVVQSSRVEITDSFVHGPTGADQIGDCCGGYDGGPALRVGAGGIVHVARSTIRGGDGGDAETWASFPAGDGAPAIVVAAADARLLLTGVATDVVQGGAQGIGLSCFDDGSDAPALRLEAGWARVSGATFLGRTSLCGAVTPAIVWLGGALEQPSPADPSLSLPVATPPGANVTFTLSGPPGASARLRLGRQPVVIDLPDVIEDRLTLPLRTYDLGTIPATGVLTYAFHALAGVADGFLIVAQAVSVDAGGTRLTQSVPLVVH
jgi:hypothetical protein